ncbi:hypothetical protein ASPCAL14709 [Aspergillus calidoustus]|uniref:Integral membrane protein n=1 Tax=Aspergillus calidoustus TaxID=454130 RepID=A0A0U5GKX5_ASPCI|nr:hypothetical protein ASPCAL14709 [Aspergillus calidoustus]
MDPPVFLETSWGILSTIGVFLTFASISVICMTKICTLNFVPLVVSIACALANGCCYYAYYTGGPPCTGRLVASIFADIFWMIQEPGISFYSYLILTHILCRRARKIFLVVFWAFIIAIVALRVTIAIGRAIQLESWDTRNQVVISRLHIGYFVSIALLETWSSFFLIKQMARAYRRSPRTSSAGGVFLYLMRSAELRLAALCCIGIARAVTYSSQKTRQRATTVASQVDRFTYTLECLFPVILLLDILSAKRYRPSDAPLENSSGDPENSFGSHHPHWISWSPSSRDKTSD